MVIQEEDYLAHVGVMGMKWHHHKSKNTVKTETSNIDKWGKDKDHNILYITGVSGSGKSTLALKLKDNNTNVIHLDPYFEKTDKNVKTNTQDKEFNNFLNKNFPEYKSIISEKRQSKEHWEKVDKLMEQTEKFAASQFPKKKVIVEGVQLSDDTTYPNKDFFKDKPLVITQTNAVKSYIRSAIRDGKSLKTIAQESKLFIQWYGNMNYSLDKLAKTTNTKKGNDWVDKYLSEKGGEHI